MNPFNLTLKLSACCLFSSLSMLADSPIQLALWPPDLQLVEPRESITGLRLEIYGRNENVSGLDLGLIHETRGDFTGLGLGLANLVEGNLLGVQLAYWGYSRTGGTAEGWTGGAYSRVYGATTGLQTGVVSRTDKDFTGWQGSFAWSRTGGHLTGLQCGVVNQADSVEGVQLGIVNFTRYMKGLQIGLWNQIDEKDQLRVFPIVNWKF
jgi:hypothetical protein